MLTITNEKRNLTIMWIANFFIAGSMTMILPFLSLYINSFGTYSDEYVQTWSGIVFGVTFITAFLFSPIWGRVGDRFGRKNVLIILAFGASLSVFIMGYVTSVEMLMVLRIFMGLFAGFISTSQALIAAQTNKEVAGKVLGTLQTGNVSGALFGPLIGGLLADSFGFTQTFLLTSVTMIIAAVLVLVGIREVSVKSDENAKEYTGKEVLSYILTSPTLLIIMLISMLVQIAHFSIQPILALYVNEINGAANIALLSGITFSAAGLGNLLFTRQWGKLGDKIGYGKVLVILLSFCAIIYFPQAFVTDLWQLIVLRFVLGIFLGGVIPCRAAYIRQMAPLQIQGEVMGYNASFRFLGNVIGPLLGGVLAAYFGISSVYYFTAFLFVAAASLLFSANIRALNGTRKLKHGHS